jgi:hypothetical protein
MSGWRWWNKNVVWEDLNPGCPKDAGCLETMLMDEIKENPCSEKNFSELESLKNLPIYIWSACCFVLSLVDWFGSSP